MSNQVLHNAKTIQNDEFYTSLVDIKRELIHYKQHFIGKTILCNCDNPDTSQFYKYFTLYFKELEIKKLIVIHYASEQSSYKLEVYMDDTGVMQTIQTPLHGNGDFRNTECVQVLKSADIIVTHPPIRLFRTHLAQLMYYCKQFIIVGNYNYVAYKEVFSLIKNNKIWLGTSFIKDFLTADGQIKNFGNICWFTNLDHHKQNNKLRLTAKYYGNESKYPKYDNYDAINVSRIADIPVDYNGCMGVPLTFIEKYNAKQFEIIAFRKGTDGCDLTINGYTPYIRIIIKKRLDNL